MQFFVPTRYQNAAGIYIIRNSVNDKVYIGSTQNFRVRHSCHLAELKRGDHHANRLQGFVNQYSTDVLRFELLQLVPPGEELGLVEYEWIRTTNATSPAHGFNIEESPGARLAEAVRGRVEVDFPPGSIDKLEYLADLHSISIAELVMKLVADGVSALSTNPIKPLKTWSRFDEANLAKVEQSLAAGVSPQEIAVTTGLSERDVTRYRILLTGAFGRDSENRLGRIRLGIALAKAQGKRFGRPAGLNEENLQKVKAALDAGLSINKTVEATSISATTVKRCRRQLKLERNQKGTPYAPQYPTPE